MSEPIRVCWVVKGLGPGGAERLLVAAAAAHDRSAFSFEVVYLLPWKNHLVGELENLGVQCTCLEVATNATCAGRRGCGGSCGPNPSTSYTCIRPTLRRLRDSSSDRFPIGSRPALVSTEHNPWSTFKPVTRYANAWTAPLDDAVSRCRSKLATRCRLGNAGKPRSSFTAST